MHYARYAESYEMKAAQLAWAKAQLAQPKKPVYLASFDHPMPHTGLAMHGDDQYYVFGTLKKYWYPTTQDDEKLSELMMRIWTTFAKTGSPNGPGLPRWTQYTKENPLTMSIRAFDDCAMEDRSVPEIEALADVYLRWNNQEAAHV